jgi:hypothetical protein
LGRLNHTMACDSSGVTEIMRKPGAGAKFVFSGGKIRKSFNQHERKLAYQCPDLMDTTGENVAEVSKFHC